MPSLPAIAFLIGFNVILCGLLNATGIWEWAPRKVETVTTTVVHVRSEIEALIDRLKPLTKEPNTSYYGISITHSGAGVSIDMNLKNDSRLKAQAPTLVEAVAMLATPNEEIKNALVGWPK